MKYCIAVLSLMLCGCLDQNSKVDVQIYKSVDGCWVVKVDSYSYLSRQDAIHQVLGALEAQSHMEVKAEKPD